jgi:hypothetical protein
MKLNYVGFYKSQKKYFLVVESTRRGPYTIIIPIRKIDATNLSFIGIKQISKP